VAGARAPLVVGEALGPARPPVMEPRPASLGRGQRADGRWDAPARWGEAGGEACGGAVSASPAPRHTRTPHADAAHRRHSAAQAPRGTQAEARAPTAALSSPVSSASRHGPVGGDPCEAGPSSGSLPDGVETPVGGRPQALPHGGAVPRTTPSKMRGVRAWAACRPRAWYHTAGTCGGLRSSGVGLLSQCEIVAPDRWLHPQHIMLCITRNQCLGEQSGQKT